MSERPWPELTVERRYPGLPKIINPSTLHMDTERERYVPRAALQAVEAELRPQIDVREEERCDALERAEQAEKQLAEAEQALKTIAVAERREHLPQGYMFPTCDPRWIAQKALASLTNGEEKG